MKHYRRLWRESPGAMTLLHVLVVGFAVSAALLVRNPLASAGALAATCLVAAAILPACVEWDIGKMKGG